MAPQQPYEGWQNTGAFHDHDKQAIETRIHRDLPGGMETLEMMMLIVGYVSNLGDAQTDAAIRNQEDAARYFVQRARNSPAGI